MNKKFPRRLIKDGSAEHFLATGSGDEFLVEERLDHTARMDAANLLNFGHSHGLLVSDDSERLERSKRQACRRNLTFDELLQNFVVFRLRGESIAIRHFADFDAVRRQSVLFNK